MEEAVALPGEGGAGVSAPEKNRVPHGPFPDDAVLAALANEGNAFIEWEGDCAGADNCIVRLDRDKVVKAQFAPR